MLKENIDRTPISFVICVNDEQVFRNNVLTSLVFTDEHQHELIIQRDFPSASLAYNDAITKAHNDIIVFMHQDVYLPKDWDKRLQDILFSLELSGQKWGVLGCYGISERGVPVGHVYSNGLNRELGRPQPPTPVQSLDELLLILKKSSGLRFDSKMPHFHLYGTDICLQAKERGMTNYAISNFCVHNSVAIQKLPGQFWQCAEYLRKKWQDKLPVKTCCITLYPTRSRMLLIRAISELKSFKHRLLHQYKGNQHRLSAPGTAIEEILVRGNKNFKNIFKL